MKKTLIVIISAFLMLAMLAGCASGKNAESAPARDSATGWGGAGVTQNDASGAPQAPEYVDKQEGGLIAGETVSPGQGDTIADMYGGRKVIRTYELSIQSDDFDGDLAAVQQKLSALGGYSQSSTVNGKKPTTYGEAGRTANLTLRVPAEKADEFIEGVKGLGTLLGSRDYADDITDSYFDVDSRLQVLKTELGRLESILVKTDNLADVIALEDKIGQIMLEIEQLTGTLKKYDALVYYTTVNITLYEKALTEGPAGVKTPGERISEGFTNSLYGVGTFFTNLFVWFVSALPVLIVLAVIAAAIFLIVRALAKRSANRRAEESAKAAVRQQMLFEQQKAAYLEQIRYETSKNKPEDADNEGK